MALDFDSSNVLYFFGALLGVVTLIYFSQQFVFQLSPTVRILLLGVLSAAFFLSGNYLHSEDLGKFLYILSAGSYIVAVGYGISRFDASQNMVLIILFVSSVLLMSLGHLVNAKKSFMNKKFLKIALIISLTVFLGLVALDVFGGGVERRLELSETVNFTEEGLSENLGYIEFSNNFLFSREYRVPSLNGCIFYPGELEDGSNVNIMPREFTGRSGILRGGESKETVLDARYRQIGVENGVDIGSIPVEFAESCPESYGSKKLFVYFSEEESSIPEPRIN